MTPPAAAAPAALHRVQLPDGTGFDAAPGESLLDAALRQHRAWNHACRDGRCGNCRVQVASGHTACTAAEPALGTDEQAAGWVLPCVRRATSDLRLRQDVPLAPLPHRVAQTWPCRIAALTPLSADVLQVVLRLPPGRQLAFHPGQHVQVWGPQGQRRAYSLAAPLATSSGAAAQPTLHIRRVEDGAMSRYWFGAAQVGDLLRLHGPLGHFSPVAADVPALVFLATGTGLAPVSAMLADAAAQAAGGAGAPGVSAAPAPWLFWGGRQPADLYCDPRQWLPGLHYRPVLSRAGPGWAGARGHVTQALLATLADPASGLRTDQLLVLACGSPAMVDSARRLLLAQGLPAHRFRSDSFVATGPSEASEPREAAEAAESVRAATAA